MLIKGAGNFATLLNALEADEHAGRPASAGALSKGEKKPKMDVR
jgi:hypothetical protein